MHLHCETRQSEDFIFGNENLSLYRFIKMWLLIWELFKVAQAETDSQI